MDPVRIAAILLIIRIRSFEIQNLGLVKQLVVEAENLLVLCEERSAGVGGSHGQNYVFGYAPLDPGKACNVENSVRRARYLSDAVLVVDFEEVMLASHSWWLCFWGKPEDATVKVRARTTRVLARPASIVDAWYVVSRCWYVLSKEVCCVSEMSEVPWENELNCAMYLLLCAAILTALGPTFRLPLSRFRRLAFVETPATPTSIERNLIGQHHTAKPRRLPHCQSRGSPEADSLTCPNI